MSQSNAQIVREYGPFPGADHVHGVTYDGQRVWFAAGDKLIAFDPASGATDRVLDVAAHAGTAFDGRHLYQIAEDRIQKIDPATGRVLATIPAPGAGGHSGLAWAEGTLWVGQYRDRKIYQIDPETGAILRTIESNRFVTGVTWVDGELWHGTWEGDESDVRRVDPQTGEVLEQTDWRRLPVDDEIDDVPPRFRLAGRVHGEGHRRRERHPTARRQREPFQLEDLGRGAAVGFDEVHGQIDEQILRCTRSALEHEADRHAPADGDPPWRD